MLQEIQDFKTRLRAWRLAQGWTQREAADHFGCALQTYQHWEQKNNPIPNGAARHLIERAISGEQ